jgi:hypothetical protein
MAQGAKMEIRVDMIKRLLVIFALVGLFAPINASAPGGSGQSQPQLRVTIHEVCEASFSADDFLHDSLSATFEESNVYRITRYDDGEGRADLQLVSHQANISLEGRGATKNPPPVPSESWTYQVDQDSLRMLQSRPITGVVVSFTGRSVAVSVPNNPCGFAKASHPLGVLGGWSHDFDGSSHLPEPSPFERQLGSRFEPNSTSIAVQGHASVTDTELKGRVLSREVDYSVSGGDTELPEDEMVFEPSSSYDSWIPAPKAEDTPGVRMEPAAPLQIIGRIQPKKPDGKARKGRIYFVLDEVSKHPGQCGNYPRDASLKDDLRFADEQPAGIVVDGKYTAHTSDEVSVAAVLIEATDTGAYGKLKASAPALQLEAIYKPTNTYVLTIPRDDDGNHVADAWERQMNVHGTQDADEDQVPGQDRTGDGLTYFDEYRGFVVVENGDKVFRRFDPKRKELLVIDPAGIFDSAIWEQASGIVAHMLDESLIAGGGDAEASRVVNFNSDSGHPKYAVRVVSMPGISDPDDPGGKNQSMGKTPCGQCRSPKDADSCKVFPARIRAKIEDLYLWLGLALAQPTSPQGQELAGAGFPPWLAQRALDKLRDPASREALARQLITLIAIHEVGHACGLSDHQSGSPPGLSGAPVRACPMYIPADTTYHRFILLQTLFRPDADLPMQYSRFCRGVGLPEFDCFRKLNVKDW